MSCPSKLALAATIAAALLSVVPVQAQVISLTPSQVSALGIRFAPTEDATRVEIGSTARVVLRPDAQYVVASPYPGLVTHIEVAVGQRVAKGQSLATFVSPQMFEAQRALAEARSRADLAKLALERDRTLNEEGIIPRSRWETTQAAEHQARATLHARESEISAAGIAITGKGGARLVAGRDGLIADIRVVPGMRVDAAAPMFQIVDPTALELDLLLGREVPAVRGGDVVEVRKRGAVGKVAGVVPMPDGTGAIRVRATLDRRGTLQAGENVAVVFKLNAAVQPGQARVRLPATALSYVQGRAGVFVATDGGVAYRAVEVDAVDDAMATIHGELPERARVATSGLGALKGMLVGRQ